jgi:hypothetical protein
MLASVFAALSFVRLRALVLALLALASVVSTSVTAHAA